MPRFHRFALALAVSTSLVAAGPALAKAKAANPAPIADLVKAVDIPYQAFTLDNGLRVIVHEDRKAPVVAVSVWYRVGSKHEPKGKTGFAHLFEHLMFNGSENAPGDFFEPLQQVGATDRAPSRNNWCGRRSSSRCYPSHRPVAAARRNRRAHFPSR